MMGTHQIGASLAALALRALGVSLGDADAPVPRGADDLAACQSHRLLTQLDDELLTRLHGSWDQPPVLDPGWEQDPALDTCRAQAARVLEEVFGRDADGPIGWADPKLSLLLPFWRTVTPIAAAIVVVDDPQTVAAAWRVHNGIDASRASLLWLRYLFAAVANDPDHLLLRGRDFVEDLPRTLASIARHTGLPQPDARAEQVVRDAVHSAPLSRLVADAALDDRNPLVAMAAAVWNGGAIDVGVVPPLVVDAIRTGWLRPSGDTEILARARAQVVDLKARLRRRRRRPDPERAASSAESSTSRGEEVPDG